MKPAPKPRPQKPIDTPVKKPLPYPPARPAPGKRFPINW